MPRSARLDSPGVLHHVIIRGIERNDIFKDNKDKDDLLNRMEALLPETTTACYAWALISNHAHFLFRTGNVPLATLMRRLLTGYAVRFNRRHLRHGQLFQNRYKSIICQEDSYLKELVRYIHLNPLRSKVVEDISALNKYPYCGHSALMGKTVSDWQDTDYVLSFFGKSRKVGRKRYIDYVIKGIRFGRRPELVGGGLIRSLGGWAEIRKLRLDGQDRLKGDERILGDSDFVLQVLSEANEKYERHYELKRLGYGLEQLEQRVSDLYGIEPSALYVKSRQKVRSEARSVLFFWAVQELGLEGTYLAKRYGMSQPGIVYAVKRGERVVQENNYRYRLIG